MDAEKVLSRLVRAARKAQYLSDQMEVMGYQNTPYHDLFGEIADAVYCFLDERTDTFDTSVTFYALCDDLLCHEDRVRILLNALKEPAQN